MRKILSKALVMLPSTLNQQTLPERPVSPQRHKEKYDVPPVTNDMNVNKPQLIEEKLIKEICGTERKKCEKFKASSAVCGDISSRKFSLKAAWNR